MNAIETFHAGCEILDEIMNPRTFSFEGAYEEEAPNQRPCRRQFIRSTLRHAR